MLRRISPIEKRPIYSKTQRKATGECVPVLFCHEWVRCRFCNSSLIMEMQKRSALFFIHNK